MSTPSEFLAKGKGFSLVQPFFSDFRQSNKSSFFSPKIFDATCFDISTIMSILSTRSSGTRRGSQHNRPSSLFKRFSRMSVNSQLNTEHPLTEHSEPESENDENTQIYSTEKSNDGVYTIGKHRLTVDQLNDEGGEGSIFRTSIKPPEQQSGTRSSSFGARPSSLFKCRESVNCFYFFFVVDKR